MAGILKKILLFNLTPVRTMLGIDVGASAIKVVELAEENGKAKLKNYGEIALGPYVGNSIGQAVQVSDEKVGDALKDILKEAKIGTREAVLTLPISSTLLSFIEVPTADKKQLAQVIPNEARKYIPVPITEVVLDWWILPQKGDIVKTNGKDKTKETPKSTTEVVISAVHNETITKYQRIQGAAELAVQSFEIEIFSSIRSVIGRDMSPIMVLDIGAGMTKLAMVEYGVVKSYHIINKGAQDITLAISTSLEMDMEKAEELKREVGFVDDREKGNVREIAKPILGYIFSEAENAVVGFEQKYGVKVKKIILVGGGALLKGLIDLAKDHFQTEVELGDPFGKVEAPAFMEATLKEAGPEFAVALGAALKGLQEGG